MKPAQKKTTKWRPITVSEFRRYLVANGACAQALRFLSEHETVAQALADPNCDMTWLTWLTHRLENNSDAKNECWYEYDKVYRKWMDYNAKFPEAEAISMMARNVNQRLVLLDYVTPVLVSKRVRAYFASKKRRK